MLIRYVLAMIAGIWMADGLALLVAPRHVMAQVRDVGKRALRFAWCGQIYAFLLT